MRAEEGFRIGPCTVDILLFHDKKIRSKKYVFFILRKKAGGQGGRGSQSQERLEDSGRLPAATTQQDEGAK